MGIHYDVDSDVLDNIANAIKNKALINTQLEFPDDFIDGVNAISSVETASVNISYSTVDATFYTDATMTAQARTSGDMDLVNEPLPLGSLVILIQTGMSPPGPFPMSVSGLTLLNSYTIGSRGTCKIYKVTG